MQGSRYTSIPETSRCVQEQRYSITRPGTHNTQRPQVCDLMIGADNSCCSSEKCLGPEHSSSEPILGPGFGNVKREMEKPALLLPFLLGNRLRPFSCSKLPGNQIIKQTRVVLADMHWMLYWGSLLCFPPWGLLWGPCSCSMREQSCGCSLPGCSETNKQIATGWGFFFHQMLWKPPPQYSLL